MVKILILIPKVTIKNISFKKIYRKRKKRIRKLYHWDFPSGPVVKNPPANSGNTGSIPGSRRSHMPGTNEPCVPRLSPFSIALKPQVLKPACLVPSLCNRRHHCNERLTHLNKE